MLLAGMATTWKTGVGLSVVVAGCNVLHKVFVDSGVRNFYDNPPQLVAPGHYRKIGQAFSSARKSTRVRTMLVISGRDLYGGAVSVRLNHGGPQGAKPKGEVAAKIQANIKQRRG